MANTTNFGWETPDDTDLVKDGAAAMRTLGNAIDTSFVDLKGGTTGQILSKASNTDLDYTWVTTDDANAIQNAIVDAKGDLIAATANDTPARLAVGSDGSVLVADSTASTGLSWSGQPYANPVLNSNFSVWQRGTSFSSPDNVYTADRWDTLKNTGSTTVSRQTTGDTTNLPNIQYCLRYQRNSGQTATGALYLTQSFESLNSIPYAGKTVTFSFYARAGANYSATSSILALNFAYGTGTDQNINQGLTGQTNIVAQNATLTTTWQRFSYSGTVAATATQLGFYFSFTPTGTASTNDYYEVTGVQIDLGSVALPYRPYGGTYQAELAACRRYLPAITGNSGTGAASLNGYAYGSNTTLYNYYFDTPARVAPTGITVSGTWAGYAANTSYGVTPTFSCGSVNSCQVLASSGMTITSGQGSRLESTSAGATILFTGCEL